MDEITEKLDKIKLNTNYGKNDMNDFQKPFLKWVGGKTQIMNHIISKLPKEIQNYHELFLGGGSVLFAILSLQKQNKIKIHHKLYAYDINKSLIQLYKHIQTNKDELFEYIRFYHNEYDNLKGTVINRKPFTIEEAKTSKESYYYWIRKKFNSMEKEEIEHSALFLFLNKTCFRGIYREGPNGFNVPYGHYKKTPSIISKEELENISSLIQNVEFKTLSFEDSIKLVKKGDFIYLDPPYVPLDSKSFVKYVVDGFDENAHKTLFSNIKNLKEIYFILNNSKVDFVLQCFKDYEKEEIIAKRAIHCKNPDSTVIELLIHNLS